MIWWVLLSTFLISVIALVGMISLLVNEESLDKIVLLLVALSAGALMGGAFIHLIPESLKEYPAAPVLNYVLVGFVAFFLIEKIFYWRHCHKGKCDIHTFAHMNLLGEVVHNFIDGLIIGVSYIISASLGIATTIAVALHEVPQEIGDFGVLIHGGYGRRRALIVNYLVAVTVVLGGVIGYYSSGIIESIIPLILPFAAGGFLYIAASDLIPELRKENRSLKSFAIISVFIIGVLVMFLVAH